MKKLISLFFLIGITFNMNAQYEPIIKPEGVLWKLTHEHWDYPIPVEIYLTDTITIDTNVFMKTMFYDSWGYNGLGGYFREEILTGKAWFKGVADSTEHLIMDLSLQIGDSIYVHILPFDAKYAKVTAVDTILGRKILTTDYFYGGGIIYEYLKFIEGVGPSASLISQIEYETRLIFQTNFSYKVCKMYNGNFSVYQADETSNCILNTSIDALVHKEEPKLYPNPTSGTFFVETNNFPSQLKLFDTQNRLVLEQSISKNWTKISLSNITQGVYLYQLVNDRESFTGKLIIVN